MRGRGVANPSALGDGAEGKAIPAFFRQLILCRRKQRSAQVAMVIRFFGFRHITGLRSFLDIVKIIA